MISAARLGDIERALWADHDWNLREQATAEVRAIQLDKRAQAVHGGMSDAFLRELANGRADLMRDHIAHKTNQRTACNLSDHLSDVAEGLDARPIKGRYSLEGIIGRVTCATWWARQLRRAAVRHREGLGRFAGSICAKKRQPYITDDTMVRLSARDRVMARILAESEIESEDGAVITLADAAAASTANPEIRRGELMTRIKGCDEWATAHGWVGLFTTHTTPSRFHAVTHEGKLNRAWERGGRPTVRDGQMWLRDTWARTRAEIKRQGLEVYGFRVAEPHHDGTPHWHMLMWCKPAHREAVAEVMREYWCADDTPTNPDVRFKAIEMWPGGAAGYVAKYIAKGIDDEGAVQFEGHIDDLEDGRRIVLDQSDMAGGGAARVRAWARAHGIRQFQAFGQPPVTVWRELRRVDQAQAYRGTDRVWAGWMAVNRDGDRRASWAGFLEAQGGACTGRFYLLRLATEERQRAGRYETVTQACPVGVVDLLDESATVARSSRKEWRARGTWARPQAARLGPVQITVRDQKPEAPGEGIEARFPWAFVGDDDWREAHAAWVNRGGDKTPKGRGIATWSLKDESFQRVAVGQGDREGPPPRRSSRHGVRTGRDGC